VAQTVTTKKVTGVAQINSVQASSWFTSPTVASYDSNAANTAAKLTWDSKAASNILYFLLSDTGNGIDKPWGFSTVTDYSAGSKGKVQAWHFLGDKGYPADCTKLLCMEKSDTIQVLFYEFRDRNGGTAGGAWTNADSIKWDVKTFTVKGAHYLALAASTLAALAVLSF
jgi:hypothetical protein